MNANHPLGSDEIYARAVQAGLTQAELAERAGMATSTFARWKAGRNSINLEGYKRLLAVIEEAERGQERMRRRHQIQSRALNAKLASAVSPPRRPHDPSTLHPALRREHPGALPATRPLTDLDDDIPS